jgi:multiple sugar transport system substrate-binding protein
MAARPTGNRPLSRREAIQILVAAGGAAALAACGGGAAPAPTHAPPAGAPRAARAARSTPGVVPAFGAATRTAVPGSPTARGAAPSAVATRTAKANTTLVIRDSGATLPTGPVAFHWMDSGDTKATFFKAYFAAYQRAHPNITITYDPLPFAKIQETLPLAFQNNNAPDVFQLPGAISLGQALATGWVRPIDDIIPDFANWKAAFPPGSFLPGLNVFGGKTYGPPLTNPGGNTSLCYNTEYAARAGFDPQAGPVTWDAFRAAAKKMTEQGGGKYFGLMIEGQGGRYASIGGGSGLLADLNWKTGTFNYTTDQYLAAVDLLLALKSDGSIFPGSVALNAAQARAQFAQGAAGMIISGTYNVPQWKTENPTLPFDIVGQPVPNSGTVYPLAEFPGATGENILNVNANTKYPEVAADMLHYLGTREGNLLFTTLSGGGQRSIYPEINEQADIDPRSRKIFATLARIQVLAPSPLVRNPDWSKVELEIRPLTPDFGAVAQGLFTGQLRDPKAAMQDLQDRSDKELDRAIKAAQAKGANVSRDDLVFPNWDPLKDYRDADYAALKQ